MKCKILHKFETCETLVNVKLKSLNLIPSRLIRNVWCRRTVHKNISDVFDSYPNSQKEKFCKNLS